MRGMNGRWLAWLGIAVCVTCGGKSVIDGPGSSGSGASSGNGSSNTDVTTGGPKCTEHADCAPGVCIFLTGECAQACEPYACEACGPGDKCDDCATASCPGCADCMPACAPTEPGWCDDHSDCEDGMVCAYSYGVCFPSCDDGVCADPNTVCDTCATSSCPCCKDCASACVPL